MFEIVKILHFQMWSMLRLHGKVKFFKEGEDISEINVMIMTMLGNDVWGHCLNFENKV